MKEFRLPDLGTTTGDVVFESMAKPFVERLEKWITALQSELPSTQQLAVKLLLPAGQTLLVKFIGYHNPSLVVITALNAQGKECTVLVHQNTVQLLCEAVDVQGDTPRQKIGFQTGG